MDETGVMFLLLLLAIELEDGNSTEMYAVFVLRNKAIADYLSANGFHTALEHFQKEASMVS